MRSSVDPNEILHDRYSVIAVHEGVTSRYKVLTHMRATSNSAKPDQMLQSTASDQVLHCLQTKVSFNIE